MDQMKIGKFIAEKRKEKKLTQQALADLIGVSNKTISKWECGNGMPEVSLMLPLCEALHITVNELLSGETLDISYQTKAEENLLGLIKDKEMEKISGKKIMVLQIATLICSAVLWFLLFADSNVYQLGDPPTPLTLCYLIFGFLAIYLVIMSAGYGIIRKDAIILFAALSFASFTCLLICLVHSTLWLVLPAAAGVLVCLVLSLWSFYKRKSAHQ